MVCKDAKGIFFGNCIWYSWPSLARKNTLKLPDLQKPLDFFHGFPVDFPSSFPCHPTAVHGARSWWAHAAVERSPTRRGKGALKIYRIYIL